MIDLISRQDAIDEVINLWANKPFGNPALVEIKDCIETLPSAKRKGEWIRNVDSLYGAIQKPYCSSCGKFAIGNHGFDCVLTNFCPNCGADMRGDEE